jgi:hypothetical protein
MGAPRKLAYVPEDNTIQAHRMETLGWTDLGYGYWFKEVQ